ncbi:MAG: hypothetical protein IT405_01595 [Candidatus Yanofskybacteria bacterium]|nr:hypothetical protein [Candidatus Yanofskybacteria bacterium]
MGPLIVLSVTFCVFWVITYVAMHVSCYLKRKYKDTENGIAKLLMSLMCESCRMACESHLMLFKRSVMFALLLAIVATAAYFIR